ncbi:nucleotidyl transferase AbiEii/AbiGii toxin family protein, partial [Thermodesulfovibrio yellowstonii]|uniref:nucleotidyl transferase AbiEii/AbiGii toxin family protein n=1 Tax=Thermodesulfovibrio yellowstonii TaxID=28262 RepID=UPI003C7D0CA2
LCYGLNRFSVDLDFWLYKKIDTEKYFEKLREYLSVFYTIRDAENKFYTMLFEIRSENYPRTLKIELRKKVEKVKTDMSIAYSKFSNIQVLVRTLSLEEVMKSKIEAFLNRKEIRDVFDIEFLLKKGVPLNAKKEDLQQLLEGIKDFSKNDYSVKLGSIVDAEWRKYYIKENFKILVMKLKEI